MMKFVQGCDGSKERFVPAPSQLTLRNRLLSLLPEADFALLRHHLEPVELPRQMVLAESNRRVDYAYFPESGIGSLVAMSPQGRIAEAGLFGFEGFSPTHVALGVDRSPLKVTVQVPGTGFRVRTDLLTATAQASRTLHDLLTRYCHTVMVQISSTALSNAIHQIDERLARWLLMCHDRTEGDHIPITHEFIAQMLAVRRPSVTTALHVLEGNGLIRSERGFVTIRNRQALEDFGRDAYGLAEKEYERLIGPLKAKPKPVPERTPVRLAGTAMMRG